MIRFLAGAATGALLVAFYAIATPPAHYVSYVHRENLQTVLDVFYVWTLVQIVLVNGKRHIEQSERIAALQARIDALEKARYT